MLQAASNTTVPAAPTPVFLSDVGAPVPFRSIEVPPLLAATAAAATK